jgi:hypothetical protein
VSDDLRLVVLSVVTGELRERAWDAYRDAFDELRAAAIQRHMMTRGEFDEVMADDRVQVYLAEHADGGIVGIATLANDLAAMPLVSPDFFAARWPEHYAAGRCWYIGFVGVRPSAQGAGAFQLIVGTVATSLARSGGVVVLDVPKRNIESFHVPHAVKRIADTLVSGVTCEMIDAQTYWAYTTPVPAEIDLREPRVVDVREPSAVSGRALEASRRQPTAR